MSLLLFSIPQTSLSQVSLTSCSSSTMAVTATPVYRLHFKTINLYPKSSTGVCIHNHNLRSERSAIIVNASSDIDGTAPAEVPTESKEEVVAVDKLPLESKLQERAEQKMKMKLAKKIRLRRKRLVRKRRLRKKG
ncbi:50S ribosomal protein L18, chloroplast precursor, putative [Ricinus communis]|uniref:50S ribosomal protein L18, chloroplast, putative n=2 Tax=Ricinus communis TaxID=3988 RepID=B9S9B8_RICCO|nr:50S ribosomal protein L18, chloroplast precursor, putative [Ricinus communis]